MSKSYRKHRASSIEFTSNPLPEGAANWIEAWQQPSAPGAAPYVYRAEEHQCSPIIEAQARREAQKIKDAFWRKLQEVADTLPPKHAQALRNQADNSSTEEVECTLSALKLIYAPLAFDATYDTLSERAQELADHGDRQQIRYDKATTLKTQYSILEFALDQAQRMAGWTPTKGEGAETVLARMADPKTWRRYLQREQNLASLQAARVLQMMGVGRISKGSPLWRSQYLPDDVVVRRYRQIDRTQDWLEETVITDGSKEKTLADVTANAQENLLAEYRIRIIARMQMNEAAGLEARFITKTVPSRFHSTSTVKVKGKNGKKGKKWSIPNPRFDPSLTVKDASEWERRCWSRFRAKLAKWGLHFGPGCDIDFFDGCEGHTDGTPHGHFVMWARPDLWPLIEQMLKEIYIFRDEEHEPGAKERRLKIEVPRKSYAVRAYLLKMIAYPLKTLESGSKAQHPEPDALYANVTGHRRVRMAQDGAGNWRWLRRIKDPSVLTEELQPAWGYSHGDEEGHCTPEDYRGYLSTPAKHYKKGHLETDLFEVEKKAWSDYLIEAEGNTLEAHDLQQNDEDPVKSRVRRLTKYKKPFTPSKPSVLYRWVTPDHCEVTKTLNFPKWKKDDKASMVVKQEKRLAKERLTEGVIAKVKTEKKRGLHLIICSQGGLRPLEIHAAPTIRLNTTEEIDAFYAPVNALIQKGFDALTKGASPPH